MGASCSAQTVVNDIAVLATAVASLARAIESTVPPAPVVTDASGVVITTPANKT
jgi:hypothetical protein